jgi:RNA polymerase sigma factor (sigma-70 family)
MSTGETGPLNPNETNSAPVELYLRVAIAGGVINPVKPRGRLDLQLYNGWERGGHRLEFYIFDASYVKRLAEGDPATESHFSSYFAKFILLKLRSRRLSPSMAEDVRQETLFRVLRSLRQGAGVSQPERFGAFVNSVCNNVVLELFAKESRHPSVPENSPEPADDRVDMDANLISQQRKQIVAEVLDDLGSKDREILRLVFFEEAERGEVCRKLGVGSEYLRVLLHRAKGKFEQAYLRKRGKAAQSRPLFCW